MFRLLVGLLLAWLVCHFFYSLGRKSALKENKKKYESNNRRKTVDSTVVEKEQDK